jgi:phospholipid transport system substrate-binding protein
MGILGSALAIALILSALLVTPAAAGPPTDQLRGQVDRVIQVLDNSSLKGKPAERRAAVRKIAGAIFDYEDTARRALGQHWNARTPQERQEFVQLFADLLDRAYFARIDQYQGEKVRFTGESVTGDEAIVKTTIVTTSGSEVPVEYRMHAANGQWRVYDVNIEGVSLVANYRTQFNKVVQTESYEALVAKLRTRQPDPSASGR